MNNLWYKNAVIYSLDVDSFLDTTGNGVGDFNGLKDRLVYLSNLGVTCIWLLPFYDSPNRDNGYDVRDYFQVDRRLGDLGNFTQLIEAAHEEGIRIIVDLVVNHTSDEHYWFQEAIKSRDSPFRDFYIWSDEKLENDGEHAVFGKHQGNTNWTYQKNAGAFFYHTFFPHQPDLNWTNPQVQEEIMRVMHFWLELGVSGFRIDAAPHIIRSKGKDGFEGDPHDVFRRFREFVTSQRQDAILLAEVDIEPERYTDFFGDGDQMHMLFNFYLNNYLFLALAREKAAPLKKALDVLPSPPSHGQYANFARNHDELDLDRLSEQERQEVLDRFAPAENMRIYGRGIRRRVAPMLENDRRRLELIYSLTFTFPGTPLLRYGQEIGMGEDLSLDQRESVRTAMQWNKTRNGGFSPASQDQLAVSTISKGPFRYEKVNVAKQEREPDSFLSWMRRGLFHRKQIPEFGLGNFSCIDSGHQAVLAIKYESKKGVALAVHNLSDQQARVNLDFEFSDEVVDFFSDDHYKESDKKEMVLNPYGYRWFRQIDYV